MWGSIWQIRWYILWENQVQSIPKIRQSSKWADVLRLRLTRDLVPRESDAPWGTAWNWLLVKIPLGIPWWLWERSAGRCCCSLTWGECLIFATFVCWLRSHIGAVGKPIVLTLWLKPPGAHVNLFYICKELGHCELN